MPDGSRCDCLTGTYAIEFDFAQKWAEAIGQSLLYSAHTGRAPGIVLIMEDPEREQCYLERLRFAIEAHGLNIAVWLTGH